MLDNYLSSSIKQFEYYKLLGDNTFNQVTDEQLLWQANQESNSISMIVNHLWGNMMSRWTDFLTSDGEKKWRNREMEFEDVIKDGKELQEKWSEGWECLFHALNAIDESTFSTPIYIRNQEHSVLEAISRQMCHYSYHVGQIVYIGKSLQGSNWKSLSIPKGMSKDFNEKKFSEDKHKAHFTDEFLK